MIKVPAVSALPACDHRGLSEIVLASTENHVQPGRCRTSTLGRGLLRRPLTEVYSFWREGDIPLSPLVAWRGLPV